MNKNKDRYFINKFLKDGYIIFNISEKQKLNYIKKKISGELSKKFKKKINLENIHQFMNPQKLNSFKMKIYGKINSDKKFFYNYYTIAQKELDLICGNEIAMQKVFAVRDLNEILDQMISQEKDAESQALLYRLLEIRSSIF